jgi:creatinine amidohydrolase/Fe(II)-dependent formamide hydrolase-like protein
VIGARRDYMNTKKKTGTILGDLTWMEAKRRFSEIDVALLPVGSTEQHGPHLPLDTDAFDAQYLARKVAETIEPPKPMVLPVVSYGVSYHHMGFSGTISLSNETLTRLVYEIGISVARHGIRKLVIINGHGGNGPALQNAAQMINRDAKIFVCVDTGETSDVDVKKIIETPNDAHAGEMETSTALAVRPELVYMKKVKKAVPRFTSRYLNFSTSRSVEWYTQTEKISRSGVLGDPTKATSEKGERLWQIMVEHLIRLVDDLRKLDLEEIHEKRY